MKQMELFNDETGGTISPAVMMLIDGNSSFHQYLHAPFRNLSVVCGDCDGLGLVKVLHTGVTIPARVQTASCKTCGGTGREITKAVYLFTRMILDVIKTKRPKYLAVVFDGPRHLLHRRKIDINYKANRDKAGEPPRYDVEPQLNRIKQILAALGITTIQCRGYESDDCIATLAVKYATLAREVVIVSRDKDFSVLCHNDYIFVYDPIKRTWLARKTAGAKFGVKTERLADYFALVGDTADNIPGVRGWGPKTAARHLKRYKGIEALLYGAEMRVLGKPGVSLLAAYRSGVLAQTQALLRLVTDVPGLPGRNGLRCPDIDLKRAEPLFRLLNFRKGFTL